MRGWSQGRRQSKGRDGDAGGTERGEKEWLSARQSEGLNIVGRAPAVMKLVRLILEPDGGFDSASCGLAINSVRGAPLCHR
jgi:hypothetical protein